MNKVAWLNRLNLKCGMRATGKAYHFCTFSATPPDLVLLIEVGVAFKIASNTHFIGRLSTNLSETW